MFEEPVTESIAPGYHELISMPMDYSTVESRLEKKHYSNREEVSQPAPTLCGRYVHADFSLLVISLQFATDMKLIYNNCIEYNGDESEYSELANQMLDEFKKLCRIHLDGDVVKVTMPESLPL